MIDVIPSMYSPAERPSSSRAAPAKKRIWSTIGGSSSLAVRPSGLPVFSDSAATSSSARASKASAIFSSAFWRSEGVVSRQPGKAAAAAAMAASTSAWPESGAVAYTSPVAGLTTSVVRPSAASLNSPPM